MHAELDFGALWLAAPQVNHLHGVAIVFTLDQRLELSRVRQDLIVQLGEHVVLLQTGFGRRTVGRHATHDQPRARSQRQGVAQVIRHFFAEQSYPDGRLRFGRLVRRGCKQVLSVRRRLEGI